MASSIPERPNDAIARAQLVMLNRLGDAVRLSPDDRRRALNLSDYEWQSWIAFQERQRPMPPRPVLADMLQRVAYASFNLVVVAELLDRRCL